ncbi:MAG: hypothetical protein HY540_01625 [Deltaproteobacteria bacterium]|nr:hypothetical protein [Deltaproteobacteria bacterium]
MSIAVNTFLPANVHVALVSGTGVTGLIHAAGVIREQRRQAMGDPQSLRKLHALSITLFSELPTAALERLYRKAITREPAARAILPLARVSSDATRYASRWPCGFYEYHLRAKQQRWLGYDDMVPSPLGRIPHRLREVAELAFSYQNERAQTLFQGVDIHHLLRVFAASGDNSGIHQHAGSVLAVLANFGHARAISLATENGLTVSRGARKLFMDYLLEDAV